MNTVNVRKVEIGKGIPKICVPLTGTTREKICQEAEDAKKERNGGSCGMARRLV